MEKNNNKQNNIKTTTFNAQVAVSKTESGMDYLQVLPDNPRVGIAKPFVRLYPQGAHTHKTNTKTTA